MWIIFSRRFLVRNELERCEIFAGKKPRGTFGEWKKTVFLKHFITKDWIEVGDYTYYDATFGTQNNPEDFENTNVLYHPTGQKLRIGKFCQLASGCKFIMAGSVHTLNSFSTYPLFWHFIDKPEVKGYFDLLPPSRHFHRQYGDTVVGNDVWIGYNALIMPGVKIGDGAVIGANSVVTRDVGAYEIVAGNPAKAVRPRFEEKTIKELLKVQWWNWEIDRIKAKYDAIMNCDLVELGK